MSCFMKTITFSLTLSVCTLFFSFSAWSKTVDYTLVIDEKVVNFSGDEKSALAINNQIPGPVLNFDEGDTAVIQVKNNLVDRETSIHWHGILLPNQHDGVPYVTTMPILPGGDHTFTFDLKHAGTYWYHSHTNLQEQQGIYGSIVIQPKKKRYPVDHEIVLLLSDWTDEDPYQVLRTLKRGSEWYTIKKGMSQSWDRVIREGAIVERLKQSFNRMPPMDISDVYYEVFLINGAQSITLDDLKPNEKVRLRVVNGAASTYFNLQFAGGPLKVISADGNDTQPFDVDRIRIAVAETYDFLVTIPDGGAFEFRATAQDGTGFSSAFLGSGEKKSAPEIPKPQLFGMAGMMGHMDMGGMDGMGEHQNTMESTMDMDEMDMEIKDMVMDEYGTGGQEEPMSMPDTKPGMNMGAMQQPMPMNGMAEGLEMVAKDKEKTAGMQSMEPNEMHGMKMTHARRNKAIVEDYKPLQSLHPTTLPPGNPVREIELRLTGNMERYVWAFDDITLSEADKILIRRGENVRFKLVNTTMMHHPIHLHGHFFRVLNGQGDYAPLKHTVDVRPMETTIIEFEANEDKDWFFHCHILYHMSAGMARVVSYEGSALDPALLEAKKIGSEMSDNSLFAWGEIGVFSHMNEGELTAANTKNEFTLEWKSDWSDEYEIEPAYDYYLTRFLSLYVGGDLDQEENLAVAGIHYTLPLFINSELRIDSNGDIRFKIGSELQLFPHLMFHWTVDTDKEWQYGLEWLLTKDVSIVANHDSDYGAGVGLMFRF